jgi:hypothetical protein
MQALPGTLHVVAKQCPNRTPGPTLQDMQMRIDGVRVPNTKKGLHK